MHAHMIRLHYKYVYMYKRKTIVTNTINIISFFLALEGYVMLIFFGRLLDEWPRRLISFVIFGIFMVLLYLCSAVYHAIPKHSRLKKTVQKIDHSMIYLMIAGSYTPICLLVLNGPWGKGLLLTVWLIAIFGIILKFLKNPLPSWSHVGLYLFMGWLLLMTYPYLLETLGIYGFIWLLASGLSYTIGATVVILHPLVKRRMLFSYIDIFHIFVILGTLAHIILLIKFV